MSNYFEECHKCVPPKRHPGCHATCPHYAAGRAKYDADMARSKENITLKYYANEKHAENMDSIAKYASRRPRRFHHK